jgi:parallel beta-helix repeat protein
MSGNVIEYNKCYSNGSQDTSHFQGHCGIWLDDVQGTSSSRNKIRFNLCYDNWGNGIFVEISSYNDVYGNLCYDNAKNSGLNEFMPCNLAVDARSVWKSEYNRIYNNTCVGGKCNVKLATYTRTSPEVNYNEFKNNIFVGASIREGYFNFGGDNDGVFGTGNTYSKNCFGSQSTGFLNWSGTDYNTYGAWLAATPTSGKSDNNVESAPDFNNESSDEYWLASDSPCIDVGLDLGTDYKQALLKESSWPSSVSTGDQDLYGVGWELGAYLFESGTIGCTTGIVTLTGLAADVQAATIVLATTGQVDLTGLAAEIWRSETLDVTKGTVTLAAQNAQVFTATKVQATAGTVTLTALSATLPWQPPLVILAPGRVVLTAYRAKIRRKIQGWKGWKAWGGWRT